MSVRITIDAKEIEAQEGQTILQAARRESARCLQCDLRLLLSCSTLPPEKWLELKEENIASIPDECEGVYQLLDESRKVIAIKGTSTLKKDLMAKLRSPGAAEFLCWEEDPMYSKRESELIAQHLAIYGKMPQGDELEDLF
jgi:hypothetical protein